MRAGFAMIAFYSTIYAGIQLACSVPWDRNLLYVLIGNLSATISVYWLACRTPTARPNSDSHGAGIVLALVPLIGATYLADWQVGAMHGGFRNVGLEMLTALWRFAAVVAFALGIAFLALSDFIPARPPKARR